MSSNGKPTTAAEWMARLHRVDNPEERAAYEQWLEASPEHRASAANLDQVWQSVGALENDPMVQEILAARPRQSRSGWWQRSRPMRLAAGTVFSLLLVALFVSNFLGGDTYETLSGEQRIVDLADGSRLHLNVATRLEVKLNSEAREVRLVHGQAFFEITPDPERPFVVTAGDKEITVIGTKFDVLLQGGDTRVTVIEGRVAVTSLGESKVDASENLAQQESEVSESMSESGEPTSRNSNRIELATQDAISWPQSSPPSILSPMTAIASVEAWRSGRVVFDDTPLRQVVTELDRYTPVAVRLASAEIGALKISGVFYVDRLADVDSLIFALENSLPISVERRRDQLVLSASNEPRG